MVGRRSPSSPLIFLHIPKTGGTTLNNILNRCYRPETRFQIYQEKDWENICQLPDQERAKIKLIQGHINFGLHPKIARSATYLTLLRHPIDRLISHYYYVLNKPNHHLYSVILEKRIPLEDYAFNTLALELDNGQTRMLSGADNTPSSIPFGSCNEKMWEQAKQNLNSKSFVFGLTEEFDQSLLLFQKKFKWSQIFYAKQNVTQLRPSQQDIPSTVLKALQKHNELDMELYTHAQKRFQEILEEEEVLSKVKLETFQFFNHWFYCQGYLPIKRFSIRTKIGLKEIVRRNLFTNA
ncbi:MAG: sulfotransferase family 2 domain-containing protein [Leptolyngbyaceae cyanobacterium bins.59]|nr:sulfotransferase family 2 domain-containing protein [Leptolyngbyaceae cyanobacterium bins.59]